MFLDSKKDGYPLSRQKKRAIADGDNFHIHEWSTRTGLDLMLLFGGITGAQADGRHLSPLTKGRQVELYKRRSLLESLLDLNLLNLLDTHHTSYLEITERHSR